MARFQISNTVSGQSLGIYEGATSAAALDAMHKEAGYEGTKGYASAMDLDVDTANDDLIVTEVPTIKAAGFVAVQEGYAIYGVGKTEASALKDAKQWVDKDEDGKPNVGGLRVKPASKALVDEIKANGAPRSWGEVDGVLCTEEEEAANA